MKKPRVLFLCTGNSARSQMAEAYLRKYAGDRFEAHSAGMEPKGINPLTVQVMGEAGIDMSAHHSKSISKYLGKIQIQVLITVCDDADRNCPSFWPEIDQRLHWSIEDPASFEGTANQKLTKFRQVRDVIDGRVKAWLEEQGIRVKG